MYYGIVKTVNGKEGSENITFTDTNCLLHVELNALIENCASCINLNKLNS